MYLDTVQYASKYIVCNVINSTITNVELITLQTIYLDT
jgi:hypothetical protein